MNDAAITALISGLSTDLPEATKRTLEDRVRALSSELESTRMNRSSTQMLNGQKKQQSPVNVTGDAEMFTTISELVNGNTKDFAGFGTLLDSLYAKNKKYFTIIKDYEIMPILIPQINRVLDFLVNECLSPDVQNSTTFVIKFTGEADPEGVQKDIDQIKKEMLLDNLLREVYTNRYKLGREYYLVEDYNKTFEHMLNQLRKKRLNESTAGMSDIDYLDSIYGKLTESIDTVGAKVRFLAVAEDKNPNTGIGTKTPTIVEHTIDLNFDNMNIIVERSPIVSMVEDAHAELLAESYSKYRFGDIIGDESDKALNEAAVVDTSKMEQIVTSMKDKKLQRCMIKRFDPAKLFKLKVGGKVIGYFYVSDINESASGVVNFAQALKDQLMKSRATNLNAATQTAEDVISKELATKIINTFDPNLGISRVEDIDLMHDFIRNNEIYKGNKRITFYYADEVFDMSRANESILTNAVFFTKLYSTLLLNNIVTKVLRGRGRQIHTVRMGVSPNVQRYLDNAMASLAMPDHNLGTLHGSFEQIMNPFNGASDIVIPTAEDDQQYIRTDYIPGQDVDMNDEFLKTLLNSIITSFGLDAAVLDATNGNLQFARTLSMESLQICNSVRNEQQDLHDSWEAMCIEVLRIMGTDATRTAIENEQIEVKFFEPKSLIIQNIIDDLNNVKTLAENIADIIPDLNVDGSEQKRTAFIYQVVKSRTNLDFSEFESILEEVKITSLDDSMKAKIAEIIREYMENTKENQYGDTTGDGLTDHPDNSDTELTPEEQELADMSMADEGFGEGDDDF